jgi:hypothetical protein
MRVTSRDPRQSGQVTDLVKRGVLLGDEGAQVSQHAQRLLQLAVQRLHRRLLAQDRLLLRVRHLTTSTTTKIQTLRNKCVTVTVTPRQPSTVSSRRIYHRAFPCQGGKGGITWCCNDRFTPRKGVLSSDPRI